MIRVFEDGLPLDLSLPEGKCVALKPNLTFPIYKEGVTTSPWLIEEVVDRLVQRGNSVFVIESDGGYGAWKCEQAFRGHRIYEICAKYGANAINLSNEERDFLSVEAGRKRYDIPFPRFVRESIDYFISMPVPKVHCMTGVSLAMKNQWGLIPDAMRLQYHFLFEAAILEINRNLPPSMVIGDGTFFLDENGPMEGRALKRDLIIAADSIGEFDRYLCSMMCVDPMRIPHLRNAIRSGFVPGLLRDVKFDGGQLQRLKYESKLRRSARNWMVLGFFHSKYLTRLIYLSLFGRILHRVFYGITGRPEAPWHAGARCPAHIWKGSQE